MMEEALSLPVEKRAFIADSLLRSLNMPSAWRWQRDTSRGFVFGKVKPVPVDVVFDRVLKRFTK
jgi:hypothetical protein